MLRSIDRWVLGVLRFNRSNQALEISKCKVSVEGRDTTYSSLLKRYHNKLNQVCTTERRSQTAAVVMFYLPSTKTDSTSYALGISVHADGLEL
jgi:hypothetical protein